MLTKPSVAILGSIHLAHQPCTIAPFVLVSLWRRNRGAHLFTVEALPSYACPRKTIGATTDRLDLGHLESHPLVGFGIRSFATTAERER